MNICHTQKQTLMVQCDKYNAKDINKVLGRQRRDNYNSCNYHLLSAKALIRRRQWHPTPVLLPGKSHGWRSLVSCSPWGREELDTTERLPFHFSLTPVFLPGESQGRGSLVGCRLWGRTESDTTEVTQQQQQQQGTDYPFCMCYYISCSYQPCVYRNDYIKVVDPDLNSILSNCKNVFLSYHITLVPTALNKSLSF